MTYTPANAAGKPAFYSPYAIDITDIQVGYGSSTTKKPKPKDLKNVTPAKYITDLVTRWTGSQMDTWELAQLTGWSQDTIRRYVKQACDQDLLVRYKSHGYWYYFTPEKWLKASKKRFDNSRWWSY